MQNTLGILFSDFYFYHDDVITSIVSNMGLYLELIKRKTQKTPCLVKQHPISLILSRQH